MKELQITSKESGQIWNIKVGSNAHENWKLLENAEPHDYFFHLSSFPSCYVILEIRNENSINDDIINQCCALCKENTKFRNLKNIKVDVTLVSNVKKGEKVGEVYYVSNRKVKKVIV